MAQLEHIEAIEKRLWGAADTQRYRVLRPKQDKALLQAMRRIADRRPRFGCPRVFDQLIK